MKKVADLTPEQQSHPDDLQVEDIEGFGLKPFGSKQIHRGRLLKHNIIDIKHMQGSNIVGFPITVVSDLFRGHVNNLINHKKVSHEDIEQLNPNEQQLFNKLLFISQQNTPSDLGSSDFMKKRLQLIYDETIAGNNNKALLVEAKKLLFQLKKNGMLDKKECDRWYKQLLQAHLELD